MSWTTSRRTRRPVHSTPGCRPCALCSPDGDSNPRYPRCPHQWPTLRGQVHSKPAAGAIPFEIAPAAAASILNRHRTCAARVPERLHATHLRFRLRCGLGIPIASQVRGTQRGMDRVRKGELIQPPVVDSARSGRMEASGRRIASHRVRGSSMGRQIRSPACRRLRVRVS